MPGGCPFGAIVLKSNLSNSKQSRGDEIILCFVFPAFISLDNLGAKAAPNTKKQQELGFKKKM